MEIGQKSALAVIFLLVMICIVALIIGPLTDKAKHEYVRIRKGAD